MAGVSIGQGGSVRGGWSFFATLSLVIALIIAAGFGPSYAASLAPPGLPIWVHLHGAVMVGLIVAVQPLHVILAASAPVAAVTSHPAMAQ